MGPGASDADVVAAALLEPQQFGVLFDRHFSAIFRYLARRVGPDMAEDLAADVFVAALRRIESYDLDRPDALPWLYGIAANLMRRHRRSERRRIRAIGRLSMEVHSDESADRLADTLATAETLARVGSALSRLPSRDRTPLLLYVWEELSYEAIGEALGIPVGTVRSRINRARRQLRELVGVSGQVPGEEPIPGRTADG